LLGKRLKQLRGKKVQQDIADKLGISRSRYSHYENEHVQPDIELLQKMADLFEVSVDYLLGRDSAFERLNKKDKNEVDIRLDSILSDLNLNQKDHLVKFINTFQNKRN
jgi:transcriptional regulator with XRE-family HTH domain